ncbi:AMP-binding protein [Photorhabdus asymbiotica]
MGKNILLDSQSGFYYGSKENIQSSYYNIAEYIEISHALNITILKKAIGYVIDATPTLRIRFAEDNGIPFLEEVNTYSTVEVINLTHLKDNRVEAILMMEQDVTIDIDISSPPLYRHKIFILGKTHFLWYFCTHHILLDGYSIYLFFHKVAEVYRSLVNGKLNSLGSPSISEIIESESKYKKSLRYSAAKDFWQTECSHIPFPTTLALKNSPQGRVIRHCATWECTDNFFKFKNKEPSWLSKMIAMVMIYMYLCSDEQKQSIGLPMMARADDVSRQALICKTNVVPLILSIDETSSYLSVAHEIENKIKQLKKHQDFRYEEIKKLRGNDNNTNLFNVVVNIIPFDNEIRFLDNTDSNIHNVRSGSAHDIVFNIRPNAARKNIRLEIDANSGLYDYEQLSLHCSSIQHLFTFLDNSQQDFTVSTLRCKLPASHLGTIQTTGEPDDIIQRIIRHGTSCFAGNIAIQTPEHLLPYFRYISYRQLVDYSYSWIEQLSKYHLSSSTVLLINLPKGPEAVACMIAALSLKLPFATLNISASEQDCIWLISQFSDVIVVSSQLSSLMEKVRVSPAWQITQGFCPRLFPHCALIQLKTDHVTIELPANVAYIMFTSGTTGTSKGVICGRESLNTFIQSAIRRYGIVSEDRILHFSQLHFDACIEEVFSTLTSGASLIIPPEYISGSFSKFLSFCDVYDISVLDLPTAYFNELVFSLNGKLRLPPQLKTLIIGGENLLQQTKKTWFEHQPEGKRLINSYGPTEATVVATTAEVQSDNTPISIGQPLDNVMTMIVGKNLRVVPKGIAGELLIAGPTVCQGYLNNPELTKEKFIIINVGGQHVPAYRTGDIAYQAQDDTLVFLGRKIREVKIAGHRVSLDHIESCISDVSGVIEVCVIAKITTSGQVLCAHYYSEKNLEKEIRYALLLALPNLHGSRVFIHHKMPLEKLLNGKIDYKTVENYPLTLPKKQKIFSSTTLRLLLDEVWSSTLGNADGNFFDLGGESLQAIKITNRINAYCQLDLSLQDVFEHPEITDFYHHLIEIANHNFDLSVDMLDIRCLINQCIDEHSSNSIHGRLTFFIENPSYQDEHQFLSKITKKNKVVIVTSSDAFFGNSNNTVHVGFDDHIIRMDIREIEDAVERDSISMTIFNVPNSEQEILQWLVKLKSMLLRLVALRTKEIIFLCTPESMRIFRKIFLNGYSHKRIKFITKFEHYEFNKIERNISNLIDASALMGYFPNIMFNSADELLFSYAMRKLALDGLNCQDETIDHQTAFMEVQKRNPGVQLCKFTHWLNLFSEHCRSMNNSKE